MTGGGTWLPALHFGQETIVSWLSFCGGGCWMGFFDSSAKVLTQLFSYNWIHVKNKCQNILSCASYKMCHFVKAQEEV